MKAQSYSDGILREKESSHEFDTYDDEVLAVANRLQQSIFETIHGFGLIERKVFPKDRTIIN